MKTWFSRTAIIAVGVVLTVLSIALNFDPLFVVGGSGLATIWGPAVSRLAVAVGSIVLIGAVAWTAGWARIVMGLFWLFFLTGTTHRLVERSGGRVDDIWLTFAVQTLDEDTDRLSEMSRCRVGTWVAHCIDARGRGLTSVTPLPFVRLHPGRWDDSNHQAGPWNGCYFSFPEAVLVCPPCGSRLVAIRAFPLDLRAPSV